MLDLFSFIYYNIKFNQRQSNLLISLWLSPWTLYWTVKQHSLLVLCNKEHYFSMSNNGGVWLWRRRTEISFFSFLLRDKHEIPYGIVITVLSCSNVWRPRARVYHRFVSETNSPIDDCIPNKRIRKKRIFLSFMKEKNNKWINIKIHEQILLIITYLNSTNY